MDLRFAEGASASRSSPSQESNRRRRRRSPQWLAKTCGRLLKHARYYWLLLAESYLTWQLFGAMVRRIAALPLPTGKPAAAGKQTGHRKEGGAVVFEKSLGIRPFGSLGALRTQIWPPFLGCRSRSGWKERKRRLQGR